MRAQDDGLFRMVVESAPNAIVVVDRAGKIVLVNRQTEELFGYERRELLGQSVEVLIPEQFQRRHPEYRAGFLAEPRQRAMGAGRDLYGLRKDGSPVPVEIGLTPLETPGGTLVLSAIVDITSRKLAEERFRIAVEASPNGVVMSDPDGRIVLANSQTEAMFGYFREELLGQRVEILVPHRFRNAHPAFRAAFAGEPRARAMGSGRDLYGLRKDGSEFPVEIGLNPIHTDEGVMVLSAIVDITERWKAEQVLARQAEELARSNAELQQFAYVSSHDLQEPLRAVAGCLQILQNRTTATLEDRDLELMNHAVEGAGRMQQLIDDLLAFSRVGTHGRTFLDTDMNRVLEAVKANLQRAIVESGADVTSEDLLGVRADRTQMIQLLQNLIANAIKYRSERPPRIHVSARRAGARVTFAVEDNGIGIDPQYFERIFRVFQRLHPRTAYRGTGIGLAVCKKIVDRHGGRIWLESTPGEGSTFFFSLPMSQENGN